MSAAPNVVTGVAYAKLGYGVLKIQPGGKAPASKNGLRDATTDADIITRWPERVNVGLLPPEGVLVLDADTPEEVAQLERSYPELCAAPRCNTPRGGAHLYTRLPDGAIPPKASVKVQRRDLDVRGLGKAYLVAPPSAVPAGCYKWARPLVSPDELPETPVGVLELLASPKLLTTAPPRLPTVVQEGNHTRRYALAALQAERDNVASAAVGSRNHTLNIAAYNLGQLIGAGALERTVVEDALRAAAQTCQLDLRETEATLKSGIEAGIAQPREIPMDNSATPRALMDEALSAKIGAIEIIVNRQVKKVVDDISVQLRALEHNGHPRIYSRGDGLLVEMHAGFELREVTKPDSLKALLHDHLNPVLEKEDKNGPYTVPSVFSTNHTALLTRKTSEFPPIKAVSDIPLMLPDGAILQEPGYHKEHGYYLNTAGIDIQLMPLAEARALYLETFNEFSYQAPKAGFTATLAFILQPFLMPVIDDLTPLYAVLGSRRAGSGTGKGYLLDCVYRIHRGRPYTHDGAMPATDEEMGKVLFAGLSEGVSHIIFDDIDHLKHRQLMAAITSRTYKGRILGVSQRHEVSTGVTWAVSGNAPDIHRDFYRRIIPIYLGVGKARAWERPYSRPDLNRHILQNRNLYVSAALSILEHWRSLGMPLSTAVLRGFDRWSAVMGGVLESAGFPHLLEARDGLDELIEVDNSDLDLLIDAWQGCSLADKKLKGKDLLNLARADELLTELHDGRSDAAGAAEMGKYLKSYTNDVFKGHYLRREFDSDSKTWRYFLEPVPDAPKLLSDVFNFAALKTSPEHPRNTSVNRTDDTVTGVRRGCSGNIFSEDEESAPPKWEMEL